ncbi:MAG: hypothetical protein RR403_02295 [Pseudoflavonifractor sp.]
MQAIIETIFDAVYLFTVIFIGITMLRKSAGNPQYRMFGLMSVVLGCGDAFHLVPRAIALCTTGLEAHAVSLGVGKFITSITMTIFYIIVYHIWRSRYEIKGRKGLTLSIYILAAARMILCLFPQNDWLVYNPNVLWGVLRNIPFAMMGIIIIVLFFQEARRAKDRSFRFMWLAITLSFLLYFPVVLFAGTYPLVGMLMIPKTLAYVWIVLMGYSEFRSAK